MTKMLVFDMDGTIADFYGVENWLEDLHNENTRPYEIAEPLVDMIVLNTILDTFKAIGWKVAITTWLAKNGSQEFNDRTRQAKIKWLEKMGFEYDEIHLVKYGTTKANCTRNKADYQVLVDDNETIRKGWTLGETINANENIIEKLLEILEKNL